MIKGYFLTISLSYREKTLNSLHRQLGLDILRTFFLFLFVYTLDIGPDSSLMMHVPHQTREQNQKACSQWTHQFVAMLTFIFACIHSVSSFNVFLIVETRLLTSSASGFWGCCRVDMRYVMVVVLSSCIFRPSVQRGHDSGLWSGDGIRHVVSG